MIKLVQILCLCIIFSSFIYGQFEDNFNDGNFSDNPTWLGNTDHFVVNENFRLQLNATEAGSSVLYTAYTVAPDFTWGITLSMDFAPSNNNNFSCYFLVDNEDISIANGYFFTIGENLSEDNLKIFRLVEGVPDAEPLGEGEIGALAEKPAFLNIKLERVEGLWSVFTSYNQTDIPSFEFSFFDNSFDNITNGFWVLNPKYTSSNADAFYFDDIAALEFMLDITPPVVSTFSVISNTELELVFNEAIDIAALEENNFGLDPFIKLKEITSTSASDNIVLLSYEDPFSSGIEYTLSVESISDLNGNVSAVETFNFGVSEAPVVGDIVLNEVLFNPISGGSDYVEIISVTDKLLNLEGLGIANFAKNEVRFLEGEILLEAGDIVVITEDTTMTKATYQPVDYYMIENDLPSFNLDEGNFSLVGLDGTVLDSFDYSEDFHLSLLDNPKGVSLERIFPSSATVPENFTSGIESTNFGTPGYENANFSEGSAGTGDIINLENDVFSPNGDGQDDQLIMRLSFPENGFLTTIVVYNQHGQRVKTIANNQLSANMDLITWDGTMDDGGKAYIGHYIIVLNAFRENGETLSEKKHVKLLDFF